MTPLLAPFVSIIIPTLEEADALPATLFNLGAPDESREVIVVDAGSRDATCETLKGV